MALTTIRGTLRQHPATKTLYILNKDGTREVVKYDFTHKGFEATYFVFIGKDGNFKVIWADAAELRALDREQYHISNLYMDSVGELFVVEGDEKRPANNQVIAQSFLKAYTDFKFEQEFLNG